MIYASPDVIDTLKQIHEQQSQVTDFSNIPAVLQNGFYLAPRPDGMFELKARDWVKGEVEKAQPLRVQNWM